MRRNRISFVAPSAEATFGGEDIDDAIERGAACSDGRERRVEDKGRCRARCAPIEHVRESRQKDRALFVDPADDMVLDS